MIRKIKEKTGNMLPLAVAIILGVLIVFTGIIEYMRLQIIAKDVRDAVQTAVLVVSVENYENIYSSIKEGYSGAYTLKDNGWQEVVDTGDIYSKLAELLGLEKQGKLYIKKIDGGYEYSLSDLKINVINSPLAPKVKNNKFIAESYINLIVPLSFGWERIPPMNIRLKVRSEYLAKH